MIGKPVPVGAAEMVRHYGKRFGPLRRFPHEVRQLSVENVGKFRTGDSFVVRHDRVDIGGTFGCRTRPISVGDGPPVDRVPPG